ncbi:O-antigen ligase family protein [Anaeromyxobacter paludicola]|uniref:O-antigen ligase-related domain-containing protein n=1 Tax=Anaeromyxobacter paludicola TaxID=2918171 RepID=A0ABN6N1R3_9BACT|nr:O-antigen ligase family protein [Anaeromyxobacter paludicola]BDG07157.1 hypothetical protein AMPC_02700 [Anaeromyxobacter paludicola]
MPASIATARRLLAQAAALGLLVHALFLPISIAGMQIGLAVSLSALVLLRLSGARGLWSRSALDLPILLFCGAAVLATAVAAAAGLPPVDWASTLGWRSALSPLLVVSVAAVPYAVPDAFGGTPREASRRLALGALGLWAAAALLPSVIAFAQYRTGLDPWFAIGMRPRPIVAPAPKYPGHFAAMGFFTWYQRLAHNLTPPALLAAALALHPGLPVRWRRFLGLAAALACAAVLLTLSRAAWFALFAGLALLAVARGGRAARIGVPAALAGALLLGLAQPALRARLLHLGDAESTGDRKLIWSVCAAVVEDHPLTGVGFGSLPRRAIPYWDRISPGWTLRAWCHDSFFSAWAEGGPLLFLAVLLYWLLLLRAFARWGRAGGPVSRAAAAGGLAAAGAMLLNSLGHDLFYASESMYGLGFALGIAAALARPEVSGDAPGGEGA